MPDRATLLARLDQTVSQFLDTFQALPDPDLVVYELWSARDILAHLTFWHESFARNVRDLVTGVQPQPLKGKLSDLNQRGVDEMRALPAEAVAARLAEAQAIIRAGILDPALTWIPYRKGSRDYTPKEHLETVTLHILLHLKAIRTAQAKSVKSGR